MSRNIDFLLDDEHKNWILDKYNVICFLWYCYSHIYEAEQTDGASEGRGLLIIFWLVCSIVRTRYFNHRFLSTVIRLRGSGQRWEHSVDWYWVHSTILGVSLMSPTRPGTSNQNLICSNNILTHSTIVTRLEKTCSEENMKLKSNRKPSLVTGINEQQ